MSHLFVISYDTGYDKPFGMAWFRDLGQVQTATSSSVFTYYATRQECIDAAATKHIDATLLPEDEVY